MVTNLRILILLIKYTYIMDIYIETLSCPCRILIDDAQVLFLFISSVRDKVTNSLWVCGTLKIFAVSLPALFLLPASFLLPLEFPFCISRRWKAATGDAGQQRPVTWQVEGFAKWFCNKARTTMVKGVEQAGRQTDSLRAWYHVTYERY